MLVVLSLGLLLPGTAACADDSAAFNDSDEDIIDYSKYGRKGARARKSWLDTPEKEYDPNTKAYCDALWMRVHEEDCPMLLLKDRKEFITLEQADKEGWRIGESGQSGRGRCCFEGYRRQYPEKLIPDDAPGLVQTIGNGELKWQLAGCHRFVVGIEQIPMTKSEALDAGAFVCPHCIERGPSRTTVDMEEFRQMPRPPAFKPPVGWTPTAFSPDQMPPQHEVYLFILETLAMDYGIQEAPFEDPVATLEEFMGRRFFFPVGNWLTFYQAYRATGDTRILESLRVSARYYRDLCEDYPDVAQLKARDPEGMAFMYSMSVSARLTLELAKYDPEQVSQQELAEAESFLEAIVATLKPICEGDDGLDPKMGIPQALADDFRSRAFNRALNGIGTIAMATAALEDLQLIRDTTSYQPTIDRYRRCIQEYYKNWISVGSLTTEKDGKTYFYYPYAATDTGTVEKGVKLFGSDDRGHFSHSMQGVLLVHDATPELGANDAFMTAIANAVYHNSYTENGSIQSPAADKIRPMSRKPFGGPINRFYMFEAFRDGVIEGQCSKLSAERKAELNSEYSYRLKTLHALHLKKLRKERGM